MTLVSSQDFAFNPDETENYLRFPDLADSSLTFTIVVDSTSYLVTVSWNTWLNSPLVSVRNTNGDDIAINQPLAPRITDVSPNYLSDKLFNGYYLFWEPDSGWFGFYSE